MRIDESGYGWFSNLVKAVVGVVATVAAVAITVATGGTAAPIIASVAISTVAGAATSAIAHRVSTGSWDGALEAAIDGGADGLMWGGLSAFAGATANYVAVKASTTGTPNSIGKVGEKLAGIDPKAKTPIEINGRVRIPDALTKTNLTEVKNVKYISNTQQLRDFADFANNTKRSLTLYVRPTTKVAKTVIDAGWDIKLLW